MENRVNKKSESEIENFLRENQDFLKDIVINHQDKLYQILETQLISKEAKKLKALLDADFEKATPGTQKYIKKIIHDN